MSVGSVRIGDVSGASHPVSTGARMEVLFRRSMGGALTEWEGLSREEAELRPEPVNLSNRLRESRSVRGLRSSMRRWPAAAPILRLRRKA